MKQMFSNATLRWEEHEIALRDALITEIPTIINRAWNEVRQGIRFVRTETPTLLPAEVLQSHVDTGFNLIRTGKGREASQYLRPETTAGTFESFRQDFPMLQQDLEKFHGTTQALRNWKNIYKKLKEPAEIETFCEYNNKPTVVVPKYLPICYWQAGKSYRTEEKADTMRATKLRLAEFWQMEFQLFCIKDTKAEYLEAALSALTTRFEGWVHEICDEAELPHYSKKTLDWVKYSGGVEELEIAGCSHRTDFEGLDVFEVAIGLDRLVAMLLYGPKEK